MSELALNDVVLNGVLPAPRVEGEVVEVCHPYEEEDKHRVRLFSSTHPEYGYQVKAFAQRLHTEVYQENDLITDAEVNDLGVYVDKYAERATYYYVQNGSKVAAARTIQANKKAGGLLSLPTTKNFEIDPEKFKSVAGVDNLTDLKPSEVIEISGLVARKKANAEHSELDATKALYTQMLKDSTEQGQKVWIANIEPAFLRSLQFLTGRDNIEVLGPEKEYMGPATIPVAINAPNALRSILSKDERSHGYIKTYVKEVFSGLSTKKIPKDIRALLEENGIETNRPNKAKEFVTDPKMLAYTGIVAYSSIRALPTVAVDEFSGSTALLWGIDVGTAVPYTWGAIEAFTGKTIPKKTLGAVVAASCFIAPYAYFYYEGNSYPAYVNWVVGGLIGSAVVKETLGNISKKKREASLVEDLKSAE